VLLTPAAYAPGHLYPALPRHPVCDAAPVTPFEADVARVLDALVAGEVVSYGEVATEAGWPGRARAVGRLLAAGEGDWAWWRVVTADGRLVPGVEAEQARRLRAEGIDVAHGRVAGMRARRARHAPPT
jgi:methylated-DNA-protein-cysteine methyltransferase-like protein